MAKMIRTRSIALVPCGGTTLNVRLDARGDNFVWSITDATGDYERLHGTGSGVGLPGDGFDVLDLYSGGLHID